MTLLNYTDPIPLPAPVTTGTTVQTYVDPMGDWWVALNGVNSGAWKRARDVLYSSVYLGTAIASSSSQVLLPFDTVARDDYGMWNQAGTNFSVPVPGLYRLEAQAIMAMTTVGSQLMIWGYIGGNNVFINGSQNAQASGFGGYNATCYGARTVYTASGASVQYRSSDATKNLLAGNALTFATLTYVGTR